MNRRLYCIIILVLDVAVAGYGAESVTLETVRKLVARNEALLNPIKWLTR